MLERWFRLLTYWQDVEFRHSLTLPFILGALRDPVGAVQGHEGNGLNELVNLMESMAAHQSTGHFLHLYHCGDRDKLVVTRVQGSGGPSGSAQVIPRLGPEGVLFTSHPGVAGGRVTVDVTASVVWSEGGGAIERGDFSCRGRLFQPFDSTELTFIHRALA